MRHTSLYIFTFFAYGFNFNQECAANPPTSQNWPNPTQSAELDQLLGLGGLSWVNFFIASQVGFRL